MIRSFGDRETRLLFETGKSRRFSAIARVAGRKLAQWNAAATLRFLQAPPGNRLEALSTEIAAIIGGRTRTVEKHLERIYRKLGVGNRTAGGRPTDADSETMPGKPRRRG